RSRSSIALAMGSGGQLLFGNDLWLGQLSFCYELNRQSTSAERKHIDLEFYVADVALHLPLE
ncbi:hypothetical protein, partial [Klebsiella aerogenes]|uniref:hypothetical protein n=1 Tax=Klebsiella aerogenes TaxID=548 RepID=UPI001954105F